ncbi:helix-turn-helix transcriptional regulator [Azospirillum soli]|uniref:helix-turn-helix transcriptional regulator n=1 Tax=Azospirillum soli TaxID=1304799 RepID=UPI001AE66144|nr:helix-turn-helix transcriptional regulator [Azospirillum soli]MBP2312955.1 DNA-binding CsgD family transcriptional regulator [Azospirillum soli]
MLIVPKRTLMQFESSIWRLADAAQATGAGLVVFDQEDRIIYSNEANNILYEFVDFAQQPTYEDVFRACLAHKRFVEAEAYQDPERWLAGALQFRRYHQFAQFMKIYPDQRSYIVTHEVIPGVGSYFSRIEVTEKASKRGALFGPIAWTGLAESRAVSTAIDTLPIASAVTTATGVILDANDAMAALLDARDGLLEVGGRLSVARPAEHDAFLRLLAEAANATGHRELVMRVTRERADTAYLVNVSHQPSPFGRTALANIVVLDPGITPPISPTILATLFGLTAAEARVAAEIGRGARIDEIAERYGTSPQTVRTQLKVVFQKTGLVRQGELVRLIAQISAFFRPVFEK